MALPTDHSCVDPTLLLSGILSVYPSVCLPRFFSIDNSRTNEVIILKLNMKVFIHVGEIPTEYHFYKSKIRRGVRGWKPHNPNPQALCTVQNKRLDWDITFVICLGWYIRRPAIFSAWRISTFSRAALGDPYPYFSSKKLYFTQVLRQRYHSCSMFN